MLKAADSIPVLWADSVTETAALIAAPGVYQLYLQLEQSALIRIGKLGTFEFPAGLYVYTGSALGGIRRRVEWHIRTTKPHRWHIDYLLAHAKLQAIAMLPTTDRIECALHQATTQRLNGLVIAKGFGSSDCRCPAHLAFLPTADLCNILPPQSSAYPPVTPSPSKI